MKCSDFSYSDCNVPVIEYSGQTKDNTELNGIISDICSEMKKGINDIVKDDYLQVGDKISNKLTYISSYVFPESTDAKYDLFHPHEYAISVQYMVYVIAFCKAIGVIDANPTMQDIRQLFISLTSDISFDIDTLAALRRLGANSNMSPYEICRKYNKETMNRDTMLLIAVSEGSGYAATRLGVVAGIVAELAKKYHDAFEKANNYFGSYCTMQLLNMYNAHMSCCSLASTNVSSDKSLRSKHLNDIAVAIGSSQGKYDMSPSEFYDKLCNFFVKTAMSVAA